MRLGGRDLRDREDLLGRRARLALPDAVPPAVGPEQRARMEEIAGVYSKARVQGLEWEEDSEVKDRLASEEVRSASATFLEGITSELSAFREVQVVD